MKRTIITLCLIGTMVAAKAQTKADTVYVKLHKTQLMGLQNVLGFAYQWLPKSKAPATEVGDVQDAIKLLYPALVADTVKKAKQPAKKVE